MIPSFNNTANPGFCKRKRIIILFWNEIRVCYMPLVLENSLKRSVEKISSDSNYADKSPNYKD